MKKTISLFLAAAILLSLCGCGQSKDAAVEIITEETGADQTACDTIGAEDDLRLCKELASSISGQWRMENPLYRGSDSVYAEELLINEDMTYKYGRQTGIWYVDE